MTLEYGFKKQGYNVRIARNGLEALDLLKAHTPDVVLLDVMMPEVNGLQTLSIIRQTPTLQHIKVVFLSARSKPSDIAHGLEQGADCYLTKPFSIKKIIEEVDQLLQVGPTH